MARHPLAGVPEPWPTGLLQGWENDVKIPTMAVKSSATDRWFAVRYLPTGARYGRGNALAVEGEDLVEFWDLANADDTHGDYGKRHGFGPLGQFTGGRYHVSTLLGEDEYSRAPIDPFDPPALVLDGGNKDVWTIDGASMAQVHAWLRTTRVEVREGKWSRR